MPYKYGDCCEKKGCGSFSFNLHQEGIVQGNLCDVHYWEHKYNVLNADYCELKADCYALCSNYGKLKADYDAMHEAWLKNSRIVEAAKTLVGASGTNSTSLAYIQLYDVVAAAAK